MELSPAIAAIIGFVVCALLGYAVIPYLHKLHFGQTILEIGPKWHEKKQGTPTMGGVMIAAGVFAGILAAVSYSLITTGRFTSELDAPQSLSRFLAGIGLAVGMGFIGFFDDYIKVVKKRNLGLTARQKTFFQLLVCACYLATMLASGMDSTYIPFLGFVDITKGFGLIFWPIALVFIYGFTNAVNLTDGIDGLASSVTMVVSCAFMILSGVLSQYVNNTFSAAVAGACVGFLLWNSNPAKVFMGDTGSMFLGGAVVAMAFGTGRPIILIAAGIVYLLEALSVMLQVAYFKKTKKRLFKMSPIHHHFELCGWSEEKIVFVFSAVALIGSLVAVIPFVIA